MMMMMIRDKEEEENYRKKRDKIIITQINHATENGRLINNLDKFTTHEKVIYVSLISVRMIT